VAGRLFTRLATLAVIAFAVIVFPQQPASAHLPSSAAAATAGLAASLCSVEEWQVDPGGCVKRLPEVVGARATCLNPPPPDTPDSGLGGWFAQRPPESKRPGFVGRYTTSGYAGYAYTTYDIGCAQTLMHPDYKFENTVANGEFMAAVGVIGAANALRERAWDPGTMWGWADPLVEQATKSVYQRVFTVFGGVTLAIVGIYLLWRSRQAQMSLAMTTAGWAILVMVVVTALAAWPVQSARIADSALVTSLTSVHNAVGPPAQTTPADECPLPNPDACVDHRSPALRASDTAVDTMLYRNWLRGMLGSADSVTAQKYGYALYVARTFTWEELQDARSSPQSRDELIRDKADEWMRIAEQIKTEDPEAYQYLQGTNGMERIGAGFIALLSALMFAMFDLTASLLVLLGFLIFRWAVIAAPIIGTVGILRPASGGFRRLTHSVVAALFNIVVFGTGAAIYLHAVDLIMNTPTIPGWLQVVLVLLCGIVGWLLLRPYRRITQLGGKDPLAAIAAGGLFQRRAARQAEAAAAAVAATPTDPGRVPAVAADRPAPRVELRADPPLDGRVTAGDPGPDTPRAGGAPAPPEPRLPEQPTRRIPERTGEGWSEPATVEAGFALYRPGRSPVTTVEPAARPGRVEAGGEQ
jgi:uncharacterized membrane protein